MFRPLGPEDCEACAALIRSAFAVLAVTPPPSALRVTAADIAAHLARGGGGLVADPIRACLLWAQVGIGLHVSRLAVDPAHRRMGLASAMLVQAQDFACAQGLQSLTLSTRLALAENRRLFARFGFVEGVRHRHAGFTDFTFVDLEKPLRSAPR